jgi:hypothetical protein
MDEWAEGKQKFLDLVQQVDHDVDVVIPTKPTNSMFLISLTKGKNRKFITVPEDDIIDLSNDSAIIAKVANSLRESIAGL